MTDTNASEIHCRWVVPEDAPLVHALHEATTPQAGGRPQEAWLARWRWAHLDNPSYIEGVPVGIVAERDGEMVGHLGLVPVALTLGREPVAGQASEGFLVHPSCQGQGVGRRLAEPIWRVGDVPTPVTFTATDTSAHLFEKFDALRAPLALSQTRLRVLSPSALVRRLEARGGALGRMLGTPGVGHGAALAVRAALAATSIRSARLDAGWGPDTAATAPAETDALSEACQQPRVLACRVDAAYLDWRYRNAPPPVGNDYSLVQIRAGRELRAVVALAERHHEEWGGRFATLMDLVARPEDEARVLATLLDYGHTRDWVALRVPFRSPSWDRICARSGFAREAENRIHTMLTAGQAFPDAASWVNELDRYALGMGCRW